MVVVSLGNFSFLFMQQEAGLDLCPETPYSRAPLAWSDLQGLDLPCLIPPAVGSLRLQPHSLILLVVTTRMWCSSCPSARIACSRVVFGVMASTQGGTLSEGYVLKTEAEQSSKAKSPLGRDCLCRETSYPHQLPSVPTFSHCWAALCWPHSSGGEADPDR